MSEVVKTIVTERAEDATAPLLVKAMPWWQILLVRAVRTYLQSLVGFLGAAFVLPGVLPDAGGLVLGPYGDRLLVAAQLAALPAAMSLLQNGLELLGRLDSQAPQWRA